MPPNFVATGLTVEPISADDGQVQMAMTLDIENFGGPIVGEVLTAEVSYDASGVSDTVTLEIPAADEVSHDFQLSVPPGTVRINIVIDGQSFPFDRVARAADLEIVSIEYEAISDGQISLAVTMRNAGNTEAGDIVIVATAENDDGTSASGEGRAQVLLDGETRTISVPITIPAGEYAIEITAATSSLEADFDDNTDVLNADVVYVDIGYEYTFETVGYWSDGTANVNISVTAQNSGVGAFSGIAEVSYTCVGPGLGDSAETGKFEFALPDGISPVTESLTLRSSPGFAECRFISAEQGTENAGHEVAEKIVGVSREVWECFSDTTINRHDDIGCSGRLEETVVKWDLDRPLKAWATGDPEYIEVFWQVLGDLMPLHGMTYERVSAEEDADLTAFVGVLREDIPSDMWSETCIDAGGCAQRNWGRSNRVTDGSIVVWTVDAEWLRQAGIHDRRIEHSILHELIHALTPMGHRDDPLSVVNNRNAAEWVELDQLEASLIRLNNHPMIEPGMTMDDVRDVIVLQDELIDGGPAPDSQLTSLGTLKQAFSDLQMAATSTWRLEGGWQGARCEFSFGRGKFTLANPYAYSAQMWSFISGSDRIVSFDYGDEYWTREAGEWIKDDPGFWDGTNWRRGFSEIHGLLVSALYFGEEDDFRISTVIDGETTFRFLLTRSINEPTWARSAELRGEITLDDNTNVIVRYKMDWLFDVVRSNSCDRYVIRGTEGQYNVPFDVPDEVYEGTTDYNRDAIDRYR